MRKERFMLKEKLKALMVTKEEKDGKKKIENIVVLIVILIITITFNLIYVNSF